MIVWPFVHEASGGYNKTGIALACIAITNYYYRDTSSTIEFAVGQRQSTPKPSESSASTKTRSSWLLDGAALGGFVFTLHCFITDSSTLITWSWTGYPVKGPVPHLHGSLTHVAQAVGLLLPFLFSSLSSLSHPVWFFYGALSAYVTYGYKDWTGYFGGLNLALFLMSIIPVVLARAASNKHLARTYTLAFLVSALFDVVSTFTVAYAFVPGGEIFRERTHVVLAVQMLFISFAFTWPGLSLPISPSTLNVPSSVKSRSKAAIGILTLASLLVSMYRWPTQAPQPYRQGPRIFRAGIWTVHFGIDDEGRDSQRRMRDLIRFVLALIFPRVQTCIDEFSDLAGIWN